MPGTRHVLEVRPRIPPKLARLEELAENLWYSWDRSTRTLFSRLHTRLWGAVNHSPKTLLKRIDEHRLREAADDPGFLANFNRVLSAYDTYHGETAGANGAARLQGDDLVAYFCAEFGLHESLPIYVGGLAILAGDHCKAASDMRLPFVGVGLLYKQGYFHQTIDADGNQHAEYIDSCFDDLPVRPATLPDGAEARVTIDLPGRTLQIKVWQARVGHVKLYLLDTDLPENTASDRDITHRVYGGDATTRIEQEIVLGVGGARALAALGIRPTVWHINEGHAAFLIVERIRELADAGVGLAASLEAVAASTVFTTHTPVPAGHDHFSYEMMLRYFQQHLRALKVDDRTFLSLGRDARNEDFNMTALAIRGSRFQNGVSRIHGGVSQRICQAMWPQVDPAENPIGYVTNAVHVPTYLAQEMAELFDRYLGYHWMQCQCDRGFWRAVEDIPDHQFWSTHQALKSQLLFLVRHRMRRQNARNQLSESHLDRLLRFADPAKPNVLTIGFARRFVTYKRAMLLFENLPLLERIVCDPERPVVFLFAGKAHPADLPGQELIRRIAQVARMPQFEGRILLLEGYDLRLARRMVAGVDVWLNTPRYPLEASGTSGMKAGINGVINLSVLDGWWAEGYDGTNGWAIKPASDALDEGRRDRDEAQSLYELLQDQVIPAYYDQAQGVPGAWVKMAKRSIATVLPRFNTGRMLGEYLERCYLPASRLGRRLSEDGYRAAHALADWKLKVARAWPGVRLRWASPPGRQLVFGEKLRLEVAARLNGLEPSDVAIELRLARRFEDDEADGSRHFFASDGSAGEGEHRFVLELEPSLCGRLEFDVRAYPANELLAHRFEMGMMTWL